MIYPSVFYVVKGRSARGGGQGRWGTYCTEYFFACYGGRRGALKRSILGRVGLGREGKGNVSGQGVGRKFIMSFLSLELGKGKKRGEKMGRNLLEV